MQRLGLRMTRRLGGSSILRASGLLLGIWGASYFLTTTSKPIYLDNDAINRRRKPPLQSTARASKPSVLDALSQQKSVELFTKPRRVDDHSRLHEYEQSVKCDEGTGISRYDVVQIARYVALVFT